MEAEKLYLTLKETSQYLRVSVATISRAAAKGELNSYRAGKKRILFTKEDIDAFVANSTREQTKGIAIKSGVIHE